MQLINYFFYILKNGGTAPRWIIFILDLLICVFALFIAYLLRFNLHLKVVSRHGFILPIFLVTGMNIIFFRVFRTYTGIIRLSGPQEGVRCVLAVFYTSFILLLSIAISKIFQLPYLVPTSVLIIYFFTASFLIFAYRMFVKGLYHRSLKKKFAADNVFIYTKNINRGLLKNAIESIVDHQYRVVGFIEESKNRWGKSIDNTKVYSFEHIKINKAKYNVKFLFMTDDLDLEIKNRIVDYCLVNNIEIKVIPAVQNWVDGHLQKRQLKNLKIEDLLNRPSIELPPEQVQEHLAGKKILITGAAGSIGSEIAKQLVNIKLELLILCDNRETGLYELQYQLQQLINKKTNIIISISDVRSNEVMENLFEKYKPQIIFHAAAYKHVPLMEMHPCEAVKNNVLGTKIVADLSVIYGVERFVLISTDKAINPTNVMGASKRIAEMYIGELQQRQQQYLKKNIFLRRGNTKFITTRFGNVLGSNGSVIPRFQTQISKGGPVTVTHPDIIRYFMTIQEASSLVLEAGAMANGGEIFVFDMGEPVKIADLANKMIKLTGLVPGKDILIKFTGLRPGEKLYEELLNNDEEVIPTHHKKIMISKVNKSGLSNVVSNIEYLIEVANENKDILTVKQMKIIVKEFKSQNSDYEKLDITEKTENFRLGL